MKKAVIFGGTGLLGMALTEKLIENNWNVIIFSRSPDKHKHFATNSVAYLELKNSPEKTAGTIDGATAIINLAGASIAGRRWSAQYKSIIYNSRIYTTRHIAESIKICETKPAVFLSASAVGYYGDCGDKEIDENSQAGSDFMAKLCKDWEREALQAYNETRVVLPRFGVILSGNGGALEKMSLPFKFYFGGKLGKGSQWFPWIHINDAVGIILWAIENTKVSGAINAVSPEKVRNSDFTSILAKVMKKPALFAVPVIALRLILGEGADFLVASQRVEAKKTLALGYKYSFTELKKALEDLMQTRR